MQIWKKTIDAITENYAFNARQTQYYTDAARYLGLLEKADENGEIRYNLTINGQRILKLRYRERQLEFVRCILSHPVFLKTMQLSLKTGEIESEEHVNLYIPWKPMILPGGFAPNKEIALPIRFS